MIEISKNALSMPTSGIRAMTVLASRYDNVVSFGLENRIFLLPKILLKQDVTLSETDGRSTFLNAGHPAASQCTCWQTMPDNGMAHVTEDTTSILLSVPGQALLLTMETILNPGDEVIIPTPCFPNYFGYVHMAGGTSVIVPTKEENAFRVTAADIEAKNYLSHTKAILINSPCGFNRRCAYGSRYPCHRRGCPCT